MRPWLDDIENIQVLVMPEVLCSPDNHNNTIKDIVGVLDVTKGPVDQNLQQHFQGEQAGEDDVTDLQRVGQFVGLKTETEREE